MTKIETDFDKLNHYQDIETYYPLLDDIKDFLYELFGDRVESQKYIVRTNQKLEQLQSNWNSLRECLKWEVNDYNGNIDIETRNIDSEFLRGIAWEAQELLDKMNELEGGDK